MVTDANWFVILAGNTSGLTVTVNVWTSFTTMTMAGHLRNMTMAALKIGVMNVAIKGG
jgi:hypothetical protein